MGVTRAPVRRVGGRVVPINRYQADVWISFVRNLRCLITETPATAVKYANHAYVWLAGTLFHKVFDVKLSLFGGVDHVEHTFSSDAVTYVDDEK